MIEREGGELTLPTFIVIGVAKAGTTSVYRYLDQHPEVYVYPLKGTNYFGYDDALHWRWPEEGPAPRLRNFRVKTFDEYRNAFAGANGEHAIGEVSPQYFHCPTAAEKIAARLPEVKLVAVLRNPAERAYSGFLMRVRRGERVGSAREELHPRSGHVLDGFYFRRLERYFDAFPRDQIKVYVFEEFRRDPRATMRDMFRFLDVDTGFVPDTSAKHNPANVPRSRVANRLFYHPRTIRTAKAVLPSAAQDWARRVRALNLDTPPRLPGDLRAALLDIYRPDVLRLEELLQRDLSIWLDPPAGGDADGDLRLVAAS
jgi:hypothetical protein